MIDGLVAATAVGAVRADVVAVEARRIAETRPHQPTTATTAVTEAAPRVISLTERRLCDPAAVIAGLPADSRPLPTVSHYDELLTRRQQQNEASVATTGEVS